MNFNVNVTEDPRPGVYTFPRDFHPDTMPSGFDVAPTMLDLYNQESVATLDDTTPEHIKFEATFSRDSETIDLSILAWACPHTRKRGPKDWHPHGRPGWHHERAALRLFWQKIEEGVGRLQAPWEGPLAIGSYKCEHEFKGYIGALHPDETFPCNLRVPIKVEGGRPYLFILGRDPSNQADTLVGDFWLSRLRIGPTTHFSGMK